MMVLISRYVNFRKLKIKSSKPFQRAVFLCCSAFLISSGIFMLLESMLYGLSLEFSSKSSGYFRQNDTTVRIAIPNKSSDRLNKKPELHDPTCVNVFSDYSVTDLLPDRKLTKFAPICDRIHLQLNHVPKQYKIALEKNLDIPIKFIYLAGGKNQWYIAAGQSYFFEEKCPVNRCSITYNKNERYKADAIVFSNPGSMPLKPPLRRRSYNQIWAMSSLEVPQNTQSPRKYSNFYNWTMTYKRDSTIVTPYFKFLYYDQPLSANKLNDNLAIGKTKTVAWMVSNCRLVSSGRMTYARKLAKYINVDIYGHCGTKTCKKNEEKKCMEMIKRDYKFYLAFENSKCLNYYTEKIPRNALKNNAIPIVLGVSREEMKAVAPPESYIHVEDFKSPEELARYLNEINQNDHLFNSFFQWRRYGEMINTKTWCRFCSMLHETALPSVTQHNIKDWWTGSCIGSKSWGTK